MNPAEKKQATILGLLIAIVLVGGGLWAKTVIANAHPVVGQAEGAVTAPLDAAKKAEDTVNKVNQVQNAANGAAQNTMNGTTPVGGPPVASTGVPGAATGVGVPQGSGGNPFKTVLSTGDTATNVSSAEAARRAAEANRATGAFSKTKPGMAPPTGFTPLPDMMASRPMTPPAEALAEFRVLGIVSSESGRLAVVRYGTVTLYLQQGDKLSNGMRVTRISENEVVLTAKKYRRSVLVGESIGEPTK